MNAYDRAETRPARREEESEADRIDARMRYWGQMRYWGRSLAEDQADDPTPPEDREHVHFHQHGDVPRHAHAHNHFPRGDMHPHSNLTSLRDAP